MKTLTKQHPKAGLWMVEQPKPDIGTQDVLIKIHKTAICGTDLHIYQWNPWAQKTVKTPLIIGHEFVGNIVALGKNVHHFNLNQRVSGEGHLVCNTCRNCKRGQKHLCPNTQGIGYDCTGAFAQYLSLPASNVIPIPNSVSDDVASILDPLGNAIHTTLEFDIVGEDVLITGAGPVGLMATAIARFLGARRIAVSEPNPYRQSLAKAMGAHHVIHPQTEKLQSLFQNFDMFSGFDVALEMSGNTAALQNTLEVMYPGGNIALLGTLPDGANIDWNKVVFKGITLKGIYGRKMFETWHKMLSLLETGLDVSPVITHHFPIEQFQKAFDVALSGNAGKVILEW